jgi:hypothetical protein
MALNFAKMISCNRALFNLLQAQTAASDGGYDTTAICKAISALVEEDAGSECKPKRKRLKR